MYDAIIIGAGVAGIITSKYLTGIGIKHVILEKRECFGGIWNYSDDPNITTVTKKTIMTSSKYFSCFSDLIPCKELPNFLTCNDFLSYLKKYIKKHDIEKNIINNQNVINITKINKNHIVTTNDNEYISKYLIICTGVNYKRSNIFSKKYPEYTGKIYNAQEVKFNKILFNKSQNVMVYGGGETSSDMVMDAYQYAKKVIWCIPNGMWGFKRCILNGQMPTDMFANSVGAQRNYNLKNTTGECIRFVNGTSGTDVKNFDSKKKYSRKYFNKSCEPIIKIHQNKIISKKKIISCDKTIVHFDDKDVYNINCVIDSTGYYTNPIFDLHTDELFKECIHINDPTLMYVGNLKIYKTIQFYIILSVSFYILNKV
jgi:cation diffusion facilitator CzcD-associated flavoprotein CzcO